MNHKTYCSTICKAACCKIKPPFVDPPQCPMLNGDNLCSIYDIRLGYTFESDYEIKAYGETVRKTHTCHCLPIQKALPHLPEDIVEGCCYAHPELLEEKSPSHLLQ